MKSGSRSETARTVPFCSQLPQQSVSRQTRSGISALSSFFGNWARIGAGTPRYGRLCEAAYRTDRGADGRQARPGPSGKVRFRAAAPDARRGSWSAPSALSARPLTRRMTATAWTSSGKRLARIGLADGRPVRQGRRRRRDAAGAPERRQWSGRAADRPKGPCTGFWGAVRGIRTVGQACRLRPVAPDRCPGAAFPIPVQQESSPVPHPVRLRAARLAGAAGEALAGPDPEKPGSGGRPFRRMNGGAAHPPRRVVVAQGLLGRFVGPDRLASAKVRGREQALPGLCGPLQAPEPARSG